MEPDPGRRYASAADMAADIRRYLSGLLGNTEGTRGDARAQARETFARVGRTLAAAGFDVETLDYAARFSDDERRILPRQLAQSLVHRFDRRELIQPRAVGIYLARRL